MSATIIDSLSISKRLKAHKVPAQQAEAIASEIIAACSMNFDHFATKDDTKSIKSDIKQLATKGELQAEISKLVTKEEFQAEISRLATKEELRAEIASVKYDILKWMIPLLIGQGGLIVALLKIL